MHFGVHFPKENVQQTKMLESGKMHLMRTFCWCKNAFLQNKMLQMHLMRTFCWCKNAFLQNKMLQMHLMLPAKAAKCILAYIFQRKMFSNAQLNIFQRKMFSKAKCYKCILATQRSKNVNLLFTKKIFFCSDLNNLFFSKGEARPEQKEER